MLNRCEWCVSHANRTTFLSKVMLCCKDFLFYVKEMAKWKRDFAGFCRMFMFHFSGGMLLGLLGRFPSNKQNNGRSATCGHMNFGFAEFGQSVPDTLAVGENFYSSSPRFVFFNSSTAFLALSSISLAFFSASSALFSVNLPPK